MNQLASADFYQSESKKCGRCGMELHKSHGCCRDDVKVIKMEVDQKVASHVSFELPALDAIVQSPSDFIDASFAGPGAARHHHNHSPPLLSNQEIYLQNCVFRI
jgi:hypothetical protein